MAQGDFLLYGSFLSAPTYRVALMLRLCGQTFAYRHIDLSAGEHRSPEFAQINRFGQVPVLRHGARVHVQSNVILQHLADLTGRFAGSDDGDRQAICETLAWEADRLYPGLTRLRFFRRFLRAEPAVQDWFEGFATNGLAVLDGLLEGRDWLVGTAPTIADISCYAPIAQMDEAGLSEGDWPNLAAWAMRLRALPGYAAPYDLLPERDAEAL
ncbi:MAG: glutathione S-transferase family protein [Sneathiellaceae bacterium]